MISTDFVSPRSKVNVVMKSFLLNSNHEREYARRKVANEVSVIFSRLGGHTRRVLSLRRRQGERARRKGGLSQINLSGRGLLVGGCSLSVS